MTRRVKALSAAMILVALAAALYLRWSAGLYSRWARQWETPTMRAYHMCAKCAGLKPAEVDRLIDANKHRTLTREQSSELFIDQFDDEADAEYCTPCTEAILDACESEDQP